MSWTRRWRSSRPSLGTSPVKGGLGAQTSRCWWPTTMTPPTRCSSSSQVRGSSGPARSSHLPCDPESACSHPSAPSPSLLWGLLFQLPLLGHLPHSLFLNPFLRSRLSQASQLGPWVLPAPTRQPSFCSQRLPFLRCCRTPALSRPCLFPPRLPGQCPSIVPGD